MQHMQCCNLAKFFFTAVLTVDTNAFCLNQSTTFTCTQPGDSVQWLLSLGNDPSSILTGLAPTTRSPYIITLPSADFFTRYYDFRLDSRVNVSGGEVEATLVLNSRYPYADSLCSNISVTCFGRHTSTGVTSTAVTSTGPGDTLFRSVDGKICMYIAITILNTSLS